jgi:hypothetical protein
MRELSGNGQLRSTGGFTYRVLVYRGGVTDSGSFFNTTCGETSMMFNPSPSAATRSEFTHIQIDVWESNDERDANTYASATPFQALEGGRIAANVDACSTLVNGRIGGPL